MAEDFQHQHPQVRSAEGPREDVEEHGGLGGRHPCPTAGVTLFALQKGPLVGAGVFVIFCSYSFVMFGFDSGLGISFKQVMMGKPRVYLSDSNFKPKLLPVNY